MGGWYLHASKWANPFSLKNCKSDDEILQKYRSHVLARPQLLKSIPELYGKTLGCWCKPKPCHGDVLIDLVKEQLIADKDLPRPPPQTTSTEEAATTASTATTTATAAADLQQKTSSSSPQQQEASKTAEADEEEDEEGDELDGQSTTTTNAGDKAAMAAATAAVKQ